MGRDKGTAESIMHKELGFVPSKQYGFLGDNDSYLGKTGSICSKVIARTSSTSGVRLSVRVSNDLEGQGHSYSITHNDTLLM